MSVHAIEPIGAKLERLKRETRRFVRRVWRRETASALALAALITCGMVSGFVILIARRFRRRGGAPGIIRTDA